MAAAPVPSRAVAMGRRPKPFTIAVICLSRGREIPVAGNFERSARNCLSDRGLYDSPLEGEGFETSVPVRDSIFSRPPRNLARRTGAVARAGF